MTVIEKLKKEEFLLFQEYISKNTGLHFSETTKESLSVSLLTRVKNKNFENYQQYFKYLRFHPDGATEFRNLIALLTINETSFFRNPKQFEVLMSSVIQEVIHGNKARSIKIWSAGCSTGEEPYSIAMSILETIDNPSSWNIEILGTDIDKKALIQAKEGVYKQKSLKLTEGKYIDKYFNKMGNKFKITNEVKELVSFDYFNLAEEFFPTPIRGSWDIIFCRNVLIYFKKNLIEKIVNRFYDILGDHGYYFMGYSEMLTTYKNKFVPVKFNEIYVYQKQNKKIKATPVVKEPDTHTPEVITLPSEKNKHSETERDLSTLYNEAFELFIKEEFDLALEKIKEYIEHYPLNPQARILLGRIYFERGLYKEAQKACNKVVYLDSNLAEAHYLLGIIYKQQNMAEKAITELKTAIKLNCDFAMAHYYLAKILSEVDKEKALEEYESTITACLSQAEESFLEFAGGFDSKLLVELCKRSIQELRKKK